jgi:DNA-binding SARP family transcriptional activator
VVVPRNEQRLVAFLALSGACDRDLVAGTLWPDSPEPRAHANLRTALWRLRRAGADLVDATQTGVVLRRTWIDADELTACATGLLDSPRTPIHPEALRLLTGPALLPGWYEDWVQEKRDRLDRLRVRALEVASGRLLSAGLIAPAAEAARAAVRLDPFRESARCSLIRAQLAEADVVGAVREYGLFRDLIARELDVPPSAQFTALLGSHLRVPGQAIPLR